jgi:hypothetical protein
MSGDKTTRNPKKRRNPSVDAVPVAELRSAVANGMETEAELLTLQALLAPWGEGFHVGPPDNLAGGIRKIKRFSRS